MPGSRGDHFQFGEIASHSARGPDDRYSDVEIFSGLVVSFWRGEFTEKEIGWNAHMWSLESPEDNYPPPLLPNNTIELLEHLPSLYGANQWWRGHKKVYISNLQEFYGKWLGDFILVDRFQAFEMLCRNDDPIALNRWHLYKKGKEDALFDILSSCRLEDYNDESRRFFRTLALTKAAIERWCQARHFSPPWFVIGGDDTPSDEQPSGSPAQEPKKPSRKDTILTRRYEIVIQTARSILASNSSPSNRDIASAMVKRFTDRRFEGLKEETIRRILDGRHEAAVERGYQGLEKRRKPPTKPPKN